MDSLRGEALVHLSKAWPMSLKGWDIREEVVAGLYGSIEEPRFYPNPVVRITSALVLELSYNIVFFYIP